MDKEFTINKDTKGVLSIYANDKFIGAIENTSASCDVTRKLISAYEAMKLERDSMKAEAMKLDKLCGSLVDGSMQLRASFATLKIEAMKLRDLAEQLAIEIKNERGHLVSKHTAGTYQADRIINNFDKYIKGEG